MVQVRQGKASGGSSSTNSPEVEQRGELKKAPGEKGGEWSSPKVTRNSPMGTGNSPKVTGSLPKSTGNSPKGEWNSPREEKEECNSPMGKRNSPEGKCKSPKKTWNSPAEEDRDEWDSLVQHMDRKTISLKILMPPRPEEKKKTKLRRDVKR